MLVVIHIGIEPDRSAPQIQCLNLAELDEIVEDLIHGFQRNYRHLDPGGGEHCVRRGVRRVVEQQSKNELPLRCELQPATPEELGKFDW